MTKHLQISKYCYLAFLKKYYIHTHNISTLQIKHKMDDFYTKLGSVDIFISIPQYK